MCSASCVAVYSLAPVLHPLSFRVSPFLDTAFGFYSVQCKQYHLENLCWFSFPGRNIFSVIVNLHDMV